MKKLLSFFAVGAAMLLSNRASAQDTAKNDADKLLIKTLKTAEQQRHVAVLVAFGMDDDGNGDLDSNEVQGLGVMLLDDEQHQQITLREDRMNGLSQLYLVQTDSFVTKKPVLCRGYMYRDEMKKGLEEFFKNAGKGDLCGLISDLRLKMQSGEPVALRKDVLEYAKH